MEKKIVGKLIGFYRKKVYKYTQKQVVFNQLSLEEYCDVKTLAKIEKGYISSNDDFYIDICSNLNMEFELSRRVLSLVEKLCEEQIALFDDYSIVKSRQLHQQILLLKEKYENYVYIYEVLLILEAMNQLFSEFKPIDSIILEIGDLICEDLEGVFQNICLSALMFHYMMMERRVDKYLLYRQIYLENGYLKTIGFEVNETLFEQNILCAYRRLNALESKCTTPLQKYVLLVNRSIVQNRMRLIDEAICNSEEILSLYKIYFEYLPSYVYERTMKRLAMMYYYKGRYDGCLAILKRLLDESYQLNCSYLLLFNVLEITQQKELLLKIIEEQNNMNKLSSKSRMIIRYYEIKYFEEEKPIQACKKLETHIVDCIAPLIYREPLMIELCHSELMQCVGITSDYKSLYVYEQKIKKLQEEA